MSKILKTHPKSVQSHKDLILQCLDDKDESIRLRALDLLYGMVHYDYILYNITLIYLILCHHCFIDSNPLWKRSVSARTCYLSFPHHCSSLNPNCTCYLSFPHHCSSLNPNCSWYLFLFHSTVEVWILIVLTVCIDRAAIRRVNLSLWSFSLWWSSIFVMICSNVSPNLIWTRCQRRT